MKKIINSLLHNDKIVEFIRFVIVGVIATGLHYGIYLLLQRTGLNYNIAYSIGYLLSFFFNFGASNYFAFKTQPNTSRGIKFAGAHIFNYFLQLALLNAFTYMGINKKIAPLFVYCIAIPTNFLLVRIALKNKK